MEVLKNFGLDPLLLGAQIVNFLVILFLLKKFLYKPVLTVLKNRQTAIREDLKKAEEAVALLEKTQKEEKEILQRAQTHARTLIEEAKNQASITLKEAEVSLKKQQEMMIREAKDEIGQEAKEAERFLKEYTGKLAVEMLVRSLTGVVSEKAQREILEKAAKTLKKPN